MGATGTTGSRKVNFRMTTILRLLLLSTFLVSCLSAPKFHLIETEDEDEDKGGEEGAVSNHEDSLEDGKGADYRYPNGQGASGWPNGGSKGLPPPQGSPGVPNARIASDYQLTPSTLIIKLF